MRLSATRATVIRALAFCGLASSLVAACTSSSLEPLPLDITITASRTSAAPGDTIVFVATIQGGDLLGLDTAYGDNVTDEYGTGGARTGKVTFRHAYTARGTYTVTITVTDGVAGQKTATTEVRIL